MGIFYSDVSLLYVFIYELSIGSYLSTLIIIQSQVENGRVYGERCRKS